MAGVCALRCWTKSLSSVGGRRDASWKQHLTHTDTQSYKAKVSGYDNNRYFYGILYYYYEVYL